MFLSEADRVAESGSCEVYFYHIWLNAFFIKASLRPYSQILPHHLFMYVTSRLCSNPWG